MKLRINFTLIAISVLTGCYTSEFVKNEIVDGPRVELRDKAYVVNPGLDFEYSILHKSNIYELTNDSLASIKIKLNPIEPLLMCGNAILGTCLTLGLFPSIVHDKYIYSFIEEINGDSIKREILVVILKTISMYEIFSSGNIIEAIAEGLIHAFQPMR